MLLFLSLLVSWTVFLGSLMCPWSDLGQAVTMLAWLTVTNVGRVVSCSLGWC